VYTLVKLVLQKIDHLKCKHVTQVGIARICVEMFCLHLII